MALILKTNKKYTDEFQNNSENTYYAIIDQVNGNKKIKEQLITVEIYKSKNARLLNKKPVKTIRYEIKNNDFNIYFSPIALGSKNQYAQSYLYLVNKTEWLDWKSDE